MKLLIFIFSLNLFAQAPTDRELRLRSLESKNIESNSYETPNLSNELMIDQEDTDLGIKKESYFTGEDSSRISLKYQFGIRPSTAMSHSQIDIQYAKRLKHYWLEGVFSAVNTTFEQISENPFADGLNTNSQAEENTPRTSTQSESLYVIGLGPSFRFAVPLEYFQERKFYNTATVLLTYNQLSEGLTGKDYVGPGLRTSYTLIKRLSSKFHIGFNFSHNFAYVKREEAFEGEVNNDRRLNLGWFTYGVDLGVYF